MKSQDLSVKDVVKRIPALRDRKTLLTVNMMITEGVCVYIYIYIYIYISDHF